MLHKDNSIIAADTFSLIQELQKLPELSGFHLVGGTALALQLGHRNSIDIDLFCQIDFVSKALGEAISSQFNFGISEIEENKLIGFINNVKTDFITHKYIYVNAPITEEGITYLSMHDIAAMKLNAISHSGQRLKDFIDIYFLLEHFSISDMLKFFAKKYPNTNSLIALKSLNYFAEIDEKVDPPILIKPLPISEIKARISDAVVHTSKVF